MGETRKKTRREKRTEDAEEKRYGREEVDEVGDSENGELRTEELRTQKGRGMVFLVPPAVVVYHDEPLFRSEGDWVDN